MISSTLWTWYVYEKHKTYILSKSLQDTMTFGAGPDPQIMQLKKQLSRSDERLRAIDKELQRVSQMVTELLTYRNLTIPPRVNRPVYMDEDSYDL